MDNTLHGFGNAGGEADRPVRCDGSRLLSCLLQWQNDDPVPNLWRDPGHEAAFENFSFFAHGLRAFRKEGGMSSGPGLHLISFAV